MLLRLTLAAAAAFVLPAVAAAAGPCPSGTLATIRVSKIKPASSMAAFQAALAAHSAWYKSHGYAISQKVAQVLSLDRAAMTESVAKDEVMTIRTGDDVPREKHDAGWDAFVAKYRASSEILFERRACLP